MSVMQALEKERQSDLQFKDICSEFEANLGYIRPYLKHKKV